MFKFLLGLVAFLFPLVSRAVSLDSFTPPAGDKSLLLLNNIFGDIATGGNGSAGPIAEMFGKFNTAMLALGAIVLAYTLVAGVMQTAHDGEVLGKRYSSLWVPIRTTVAIAVLIPVSGSGYAPIQQITMYAARLGIGLADVIWQAGIDGLSKEGLVANAPPPDVEAAAASVLKGLVCVKAVNQEFAKMQAQGANPGEGGFSASTSSATDDNGAATTTVSFGGDGVSHAKNVCGSVTISSRNATIAANSTNFSVDVSSVINAHTTAFNQMLNSLAPVADAIVNNQAQGASVSAAVASAALQYENTVRAAVAGIQGNNSADVNFKSNAQADGWITAGLWYMKIAQMNDTIASAASIAPTVEAVHESDLNPYSSAVMPVVDRVNHLLMQPGVGAAYQNETGNASSLLDKVFEKPGLRILDAMTTIGNGGWMGPQTVNPLVQAKNLGDWVMSSAYMAMGAYALIKATTDAADTAAKGIPIVGGEVGAVVGIPKSILAAIGSGITILYLSLLFFGTWLSTYLPLLPYIAWVAAVLGWITVVFEAMVAGPLWAILHLNPEGEGIGQRTENGYIFVAALVLRPALMVIGFIASGAAMIVVGGFVNWSFMTVVAGAQHNSVTGIPSIIGYLAAYIGLMMMVINKSNELIHVVPDRILQWIGNATAPGHQDSERHAKDIFVAGKSAGHGATSSGVQAGVKSAQEGKGTGVKPNGLPAGDTNKTM